MRIALLCSVQDIDVIHSEPYIAIHFLHACVFFLNIFVAFIHLFALSYFSFIGFRYWNDPEVLQKLGQAMGLGAAGEAATSAELSAQDEAEEETGYEDESTVHHTASVGDVEVISIFFDLCLEIQKICSILFLSFCFAAWTNGMHILDCYVRDYVSFQRQKGNLEKEKKPYGMCMLIGFEVQAVKSFMVSRL